MPVVTVLLSSAAIAQKAPEPARVGVLVSGAPLAEHRCVQALRQGMAELGYVEDRSYVLDLRHAGGRPEQDVFPQLAAELVKNRADVVVSVSASGLVAAKEALQGVPVVVAAGSLLVEIGLVQSLARPGGNITGISLFSPDLMEKRLQLLSETVPNLQRVAVLTRFVGPNTDRFLSALADGSRKKGWTLQFLEVAQEADLPAAFQKAVRANAQAVMTTQGPFFAQYRRQIADLALKHRLPSFSGESGAAEAGTLIAHGPSIPDSCRRAAGFVDRILKGARPADLPVEQPLRYPLVINLKTARTLGLTVPAAVLLRADQIIE